MAGLVKRASIPLRLMHAQLTFIFRFAIMLPYSHSIEAVLLGYLSKIARLGAAITAGLFCSGSEETKMSLAEDSQASIRSSLRRRRRVLGLTQQDAASFLGMSRMTYHRIETGTRRIRFAELAAMCEAFNCHVGELVHDSQLASAYIYAAKAILGETAA
jgi:DNA-binding XRE family transcriptional regulator